MLTATHLLADSSKTYRILMDEKMFVKEFRRRGK